MGFNTIIITLVFPIKKLMNNPTYQFLIYEFIMFFQHEPHNQFGILRCNSSCEIFLKIEILGKCFFNFEILKSFDTQLVGFVMDEIERVISDTYVYGDNEHLDQKLLVFQLDYLLLLLIGLFLFCIGNKKFFLQDIEF